MAECGVLAHKGVGHFLAGDCRAYRYVAAGERLCDGEYVRLDAPMLGGEHLARAPESGDDLVADHNHAVLVAYFAYGGPVFGMRDVDARRRGYRLAYESRHGGRAFVLYGDVQVPGALQVATVECAAVYAAIGVRLRDVDVAGH